jgi:hypothetical protein
MIMKKMVRLTAATSKNYETGQIHAVKGCSHRLVVFVWEIAHLMMCPVNIITSTIYLYTILGTSFLFGLSLLFICFWLDKRIRD